MSEFISEGIKEYEREFFMVVGRKPTFHEMGNFILLDKVPEDTSSLMIILKRQLEKYEGRKITFSDFAKALIKDIDRRIRRGAQAQ